MDQTNALLGVLVGRRTHKNKPFSQQTTYFRRLIRAGASIGVTVFVFSPPGIQWRRRAIIGWTWNGKRWIRRRYPLPQAVYDRISPKHRLDYSKARYVRNRFVRYGIPYFNTFVGDKWTLHRRFLKEPDIRDALPPTRILTLTTMRRMMRDHGEVFTKPARGGQGRGVGWAKRDAKGYLYRINGRRRPRGGRVKTLSALYRRCRSSRGRMLVQRAIPMLKINGRVFDVRALVQRGTDGEWSLTGMVARLGAPRKKVTNIHAGGRARTLESILMEAGATEEQVQAVVQRSAELAMGVAHHIGNASANVGELGIDLAVDEDFQVWFLEANSRTGRISFHRAGLKEAATRADRAPAEYALYLAQRADGRRAHRMTRKE